MTARLLLPLLATLFAGCIATFLVSMGGRGRSRLDARLKGLQDRIGSGSTDPPAPRKVARITRSAVKVGAALVPEDEKERTQLKARLVHAGFYGKQAMGVFLGVKMLLMVTPALVALVLGLLGLFKLRMAVPVGGCLGIIGMIGPGFWLDRMKKKRQLRFRRALPDALDVIVICLEGGLSLPGALRRVASELREVHRELASELDIALREIQLGRTPGESLRNIGERSDLEELRSLAGVITQAERYGAGLIKSLRVHADTLRLRRQQKAEEMAQKAGTKILFPTLLFIFPAIFIVILGPAVMQISATLLTDR
jgi:tight adherence protein C